MLMDAILKLHEKIRHEKLGVNRRRADAEAERAALEAAPTSEMKGLLR
jgi:NADH-quinone oxidoreductase subunit B